MSQLGRRYYVVERRQGILGTARTRRILQATFLAVSMETQKTKFFLIHAKSSTSCGQLAAASAALTIWALGELVRWHYDNTGDRIIVSQENTESAIMEMGNRIASEMSALDGKYNVKMNQLYSETQGKLNAMDELLRGRLTTASTTTTTTSTIFNTFKDGNN